MNCMAFTYYVMLIAKHTSTGLHHQLKLLPSVLLSCTDSNQPRWFHVDILYACSWAVICRYSWCYQASTMIDWKIVSSYTDSRHELQNM